MKTFEVQVFLTIPVTLEVEAETEELAASKVNADYDSIQERFSLIQDYLPNGSIYLEVEDIELVSEEEEPEGDELDLRVGDEVYWTDPDQGLYSGYGVITKVHEGDIFTIRKADGGEVEVFKHELS